MATTLATTALQLSEAASRKGSPEHQALKSLLTLVSQAGHSPAKLVVDGAGESAVPGLMIELLRQVAAVLERGDGVLVSEVARELTTTEAARLLGVSRPTLIGLLDRGEIAAHKVGTHRRLTLRDTLAYRRRHIAQQRAAYEALMAEQDELGVLD